MMALTCHSSYTWTVQLNDINWQALSSEWWWQKVPYLCLLSIHVGRMYVMLSDAARLSSPWLDTNQPSQQLAENVVWENKVLGLPVI